MNCFVASAFNKDDVDAIYDRAIVPVLRELKVSALRVDRVQHNEDIDDKIFDLLNAADICVADLTHARPSVYYEAGYAAASQKPVIYIARADHFRDRDADPEGLHRIHFDLRMKNIISWKAPNSTFKDALRRRVAHVIRPLRRKTVESESQKRERASFADLSIRQRLNAIRERGKHLLHRRSFTSLQYDPSIMGPYSGLKFVREKLRIRESVHLAVLDRIDRNEFERIRNVTIHRSAIDAVTADVRQIHTLVIVATLTPLRSERLARLLPRFGRVSEQVYQRATPGRPNFVPIIETVAAIDSIKSLGDFRERFLAILREQRLA
jgi:hypothetical protein